MRLRLSVCCALAAALAFTLVTLNVRAQTASPAGKVIISELRLSGPAGPDDEYIEIYNNTDEDIFVMASDQTNGWGVAAADGATRCVIPNRTRLPARGHYLCAHESGYSLRDYPAGEPQPAPSPGAPGTAVPDATYDIGIPEGVGVALFTSAAPANQNSRTLLDAFGFADSPGLFKEGDGFPNAPTANDQQPAFYRDRRADTPMDTNNNAADFLLVDTSGRPGTLLGAPGPENLSSPVVSVANVSVSLLDPSVSASQTPNRERRPNVVPNGNLGTLLVRRTFTNKSDSVVTRLRFRVIDITTLGSEGTCGAGVQCADVRALTSSDGEAGLNGQVVTVRGVRLEQPPSQPNGGGFNSSLSADFIDLGAPLAPGESVNIQFMLGVMRSGSFRFLIDIESLTAPETQLITGAGPLARR